ncbi:MAG: tetratricopeptide repeat-containing sensor histidine kinase [Candidatus Kapabacteria bacterium]|nr:tetratricopeptide repeat-containing sensor histidine kinase [Candidatus Kapabacteria bacterium]
MIKTFYSMRSIAIFIFVLFSMYFLFTSNLFSHANKYENEVENLLKNKTLKEKFKCLDDTSRLCSDYNKAIYTSNKYLELASQINDKKQIATGYRLIGRTYWLQGKLSLSQENNFKALKLYEEINDTPGLAQTLKLIGAVFVLQKELNKSIEYSKKALEKFEQVNDLQGIANVCGNLAGIYKAQQKYNESLDINFKALSIYRKLDVLLYRKADSSMGIAMCFAAIADIHFEKSNLDSALYYYFKSLDIQRFIKHKNGIAGTLIAIAEIKLSQKKYKEAERLSLEGLKVAKEISSNLEISYSLKQLSTANKGLKNYQKALEYSEEYNAICDTINKYDGRAISAKLELQNETDKFKLESEIKNTQQRYIYIIVAVVVATLITILLLIYYQSRAKGKLNKELKELNGTKDKLFSIISHDLKTPLSGFRNLSKLMRENANNLSESDKTKYFQNFEDTSNNLLKLLDNLLNWSQIQTGKMRIFPDNIDLKDILDTEISLFNEISEQKSINVTSNVANQIIFADKDMIHTVFRNLIANALKYSKQDSIIEIKAIEEKENILIKIKDNGIGITNEDKAKLFHIESKISRLGTSSEKGTGLGLTLCKEFVEKNKGKIWFESELGSGSTFFVSLPKATED